MKIENLRKLSYWECFKEGGMGTSRKNIQIQGKNKSKAEQRLQEEGKEAGGLGRIFPLYDDEKVVTKYYT